MKVYTEVRYPHLTMQRYLSGMVYSRSIINVLCLFGHMQRTIEHACLVTTRRGVEELVKNIERAEHAESDLA